MKILITGTNSGLGKYLSRQFDDVDNLDRSKTANDFSDIFYDIIIHSAAKVVHYNWEDKIPYGFLEDNIFLTDKLLNLNFSKFIYISSIDQNKNTPYGISKRLSEVIIKSKSNSYLIIRPSALLGKDMRMNSFQKIIKGENIGLSEDSIMNYILYEDVLNLINSDKQGLVTIRAKEDIELGQISKLVNSKTIFGDYKFVVESPKEALTTDSSSKDNIVKFLGIKNER